jgi:hypothetical protein
MAEVGPRFAKAALHNNLYYQRIEAAEKNLILTTLNRPAKAFGMAPAELLIDGSK